MNKYSNFLKKFKQKNKGFTMVELIIVIAIIAILAAVIAPQYLRFVESAKETSDLVVANNIIEAATLAVASPDVNLPAGHYVEVLWTAGADSKKYDYEGLILVRTPMRSSVYTASNELIKLTDDAIIKEYAEYLISLLGEEAVAASSQSSLLDRGYAAFLAKPESQLANEAALGFHINTTTGEVVLATWSGNGDVNKWVDIGLSVSKTE